MNAFRILADVSHTASKCILMWAIHSNKSAEGVSLLTQLMYIIVFATRYLDLFWTPPFKSLWNTLLKIFYITSSVYIILLMTRVYARTREREKAWKLSAYVTVGALAAAPLVNLVFGGTQRVRPFKVTWTYSIILEAFCVLPQLILLRQTSVPTVIDSFYLVTLGSYRGFYILNWIWRAAHRDRPDIVKVIFGVIQTAFYLDFAWVYWTRQRVKLRGGGVVDSDDLRKGFLVNRFIDGRNSVDEADDDVENGDSRPNPGATAGTKTVNRWGNRGVSISADDTLAKSDRARAQNDTATAKANAPEARAAAPDDEDAFLSDDDDGDAPILSGAVHDTLNANAEWRDSAKGH